tara:strand:- start:5820 stop:7460 length:1641 start_codon:yes stop_codon:yes gene_type:complete
MAWQKRNMFSSAVNMQRGGAVPWPGYEGGGKIKPRSTENQALHRDRVGTFSVLSWRFRHLPRQQQIKIAGRSDVENMSRREQAKAMQDWVDSGKGSQPYSDSRRGEDILAGMDWTPSGYVFGGEIVGGKSGMMPTQLFEEGDQDINMALNNMASMTNPSIEQIKDTESVSIGPSMEDEMAMDQGPSAEGIKDKYQNIAKQYAMNLAEEGGDMNLFMKQAKQIEIAYANELEKMGEEITPGNQLMTPEFIEEIQLVFTGDVPEMVTGGPVTGMTEAQAMEELKILRLDNRFTPQMWINASEEQKTKMRRLAPLISTVTNTEDDNKAVMDRLDELLQQRTDLADTTATQRDKYARRMAEMPLTKQGGFGGFVEQMNAYRANQATNLDAVLQDTTKDKAEAIEDAMNAIRYGARASSSKSSQNIPAAVIEDYYGVDTLDKTYKEHMSLQSKGVEGQFDVFSEIPGFIALYGRLPKSIEESYGLGDTKIVQGVPETFYNFYNVHKNITINAWNQLKARGTMGAFKKGSDRTPVPQKLIWTRAVEAWNSLP